MLLIMSYSNIYVTVQHYSQHVDLGQLQATCRASLSLPILNRTGGKVNREELIDQDKDADITCQLPSSQNRLNLEKSHLTYCQLKLM